jgi:alkyl sulfatase BDS1-like metallo-beta-lactamase superfamily hydrolase
MKLLIHLVLTGPDGADYSLFVDDGWLRVRVGLHRPADAIITMKSALFLKLLSGRTSWSQEMLAGGMLIEGQPHAWMVVAGIVASFRGQVETTGPPGWGPRLLGRWLASKGDV